VQLHDKDRIVAGGVALVYVAGMIAGWLLIGQLVLVPALAVIVGLLVALQFEVYRRLQRDLREGQHAYEQTEALFSLFASVRVRQPLPPMRGWAISPDFANVVVSLVRERRPRRVLELGSGVSTLIAGYCLQEIGAGSIVSLDHDEQFSRVSAANIARHGLQDIATIIHAPLTDSTLDGKTWRWYNPDAVTALAALGPIDMLIVDGPPYSAGHMARYPAVPIVFPLLSDNAVILVDDASRRDEQEMIALWRQRHGDLVEERVEAEKGAVILRRPSETIRHSERSLQHSGQRP